MLHMFIFGYIKLAKNKQGKTFGRKKCFEQNECEIYGIFWKLYGNVVSICQGTSKKMKKQILKIKKETK